MPIFLKVIPSMYFLQFFIHVFHVNFISSLFSYHVLLLRNSLFILFIQVGDTVCRGVCEGAGFWIVSEACEWAFETFTFGLISIRKHYLIVYLFFNFLEIKTLSRLLFINLVNFVSRW